ncbi:MAG: recombinase family protein, partial [Paracoccaceae bacterium]
MHTVTKAHVYCRVSTLKQAESGQGIDIQLKLCREYCERENIEIVREFVDRGISGAIMDRPELADMLGD